MWTPINGSFSNMLLDIANIGADTSTPLAETLYTAMKYFQQDPSLPSGYVSYAGAGPWYPGGPNDPFYNFGEPLPAVQSFVLMLTDGVTTMDQNIPELYRSYDGDTNATTRTYANSGSDYLDDVALYAHLNDLRADLEGIQKIDTSVVYAFGKDPMAKTLLQETAMNGGFQDANGNIRPDGYANDGDFSKYPAAQRLEWDKDGDGVPDNFFEAQDGYVLEAQLLKAINGMTAFEDSCSDGIDNDADGLADCADADCREFDNDNDGYTVCTGDCDEHNATVHPGAAEVCNGVDDNCNGQTDEGCSSPTPTPLDGDSIEDPYDNCPAAANPLSARCRQRRHRRCCDQAPAAAAAARLPASLLMQTQTALPTAVDNCPNIAMRSSLMPTEMVSAMCATQARLRRLRPNCLRGGLHA